MNPRNLDSLSIKEKIGQLFFIGIPADTVDDVTARLLSDIQPGGVCLFARNIRTPEQVRGLLDSIRGDSNVPPFLSLDQEGGLVDRLRRIIGPMPAANRIKTVSDAGKLAELIVEAARILGFNMDFAPVVDVINESRSAFSNGLHSRAFGRTQDDVIAFAGEFLRVLQAGGCIGCIKHFPGLGASEVDSHEELPAVATTMDELESIDLQPYKILFRTDDVQAVMVAHAVYPAHHLQETDQNGKLLPSSLSSNIVTKLLRHELGYDGVVITDDLEMGAIVKNYGIGEASVLAIEAGEDMVSICAGVEAIYEAYTAITDAVETGRLSESRLDRSVERILALKLKLKDPLGFDTDRLQAISSEITEFNEHLN
jgi:beta-N-acetylhexosaminidase